MSEVFYLKYRDTRPILEVALEEPDPLLPGKLRPFDLTGSSTYKLHIKLSSGIVLTRDMVVVGAPTSGVLRYTWLTSDWDAGQLVVSPAYPPPPDVLEHRMEYEVIGGSSRITFPNDGYDVLRILDDIGQG